MNDHHIILNIETSGNVCAVGIGDPNGVIRQEVLYEKNIHSTMLARIADDCIKSSGIELSAIKGVCISLGPGSFTGLRIGMGFVKGFAYGLQIPVFGLPTLRLIALSAVESNPGLQRILTLIDARRNEYFCGVYTNMDGNLKEDEAPSVLTIEQLRSRIKEDDTLIGFQLTTPAISILDKFTSFYEMQAISLEVMNREAIKLLQKKEVVNPDNIEPIYMRRFAGER